MFFKWFKRKAMQKFSCENLHWVEYAKFRLGNLSLFMVLASTNVSDFMNTSLSATS